jgi:hypothetical protein
LLQESGPREGKAGSEKDRSADADAEADPYAEADSHADADSDAHPDAVADADAERSEYPAPDAFLRVAPGDGSARGVTS